MFSIAQLTLKLLLEIDHQFNKNIYFEYIGMRLATIFCPVGRKKNDLFVSNAKQICSFRPMNYFPACIKRKFVELRPSGMKIIIFYLLCMKKRIIPYKLE